MAHRDQDRDGQPARQPLRGDAALAGCKVELVFDPFDLSDIDVHHHGRGVGKAVPFQIGRHVHPKAHTDTPAAAPPTGIDYLHLIAERHTRALGQRLQYAHLSDPTPTGPGKPTTAAHPPTDQHELAHEGDLPAMTRAKDTSTEHPHPPPPAGPDHQLEAELRAFAARLGPDPTTSPAVTTAPKEHQ